MGIKKLNPHYNFSFCSYYGKKYEGRSTVYHGGFFPDFKKQLYEELVKANERKYNNIIFVVEDDQKVYTPVLFCEIINVEYEKEERGFDILSYTNFNIKIIRFVKSNIIYSESEWDVLLVGDGFGLSSLPKGQHISLLSLSIYNYDTSHDINSKSDLTNIIFDSYQKESDNGELFVDDKRIEKFENTHKNIILKFDVTQHRVQSETWLFDGKLKLFRSMGGDGVIEINNIFYGHIKEYDPFIDNNESINIKDPKKITWKWIHGKYGAKEKKYNKGELFWEVLDEEEQHVLNNISPCNKIYHFKYFDEKDNIVFEVSGCGGHLTEKCYWKFKEVKNIYINNYESSIIFHILNLFREPSDILNHFLRNTSYSLEKHNKLIGLIDQDHLSEINKKYKTSMIEKRIQYPVFDTTKPATTDPEASLEKQLSEDIGEMLYCYICESQSHNPDDCPSVTGISEF